MKKLRPFSARALRTIAANDRVHPGVYDHLTVLASNIRALSGDEWEQITPWGNFPNVQGLQRVTRAQGEAMVKTFNSLLGKAKNAFRGIPVFVGHPDVDPEVYTDHRRYGRIDGLEVREDGLYGKVAWNDIGEHNKQQGYHVYPSSVWRFKRCPGGVIEPFELRSVGLTNTPNIPGVQPWARNIKPPAAANAGTSDGARKGWETRRRGGASGANNPRAIKALAGMKAKKAGRKAGPDDRAKASEKLQARSDATRAKHQAVIDKVNRQGGKASGPEEKKAHATAKAYMQRKGYGATHEALPGKPMTEADGRRVDKDALKVPSAADKAKWDAHAEAGAKAEREKMAAIPKTKEEPLWSEKKTGSTPSPLPAPKAAPLMDRLAAGEKPAVIEGPKTMDRILTGERPADMASVRPPLPAPKSASSSSGGGTHIHIHAAPDMPAPAAKRGFLGSLIDAFARPHVHEGGATNDSLYFDDDDFYGRSRRVARNARKTTTAEA